MGRRTHYQRDYLGSLAPKLEKITHSPLRQIGVALSELVSFLQAALEAGGITSDVAAIIARDAEETVNNLPQTFNERFYFDAAMIQALTAEWNCGSARLSNMIIPRPGASWGHSSIMMPEKQRNETVHLVHLILFPGDDNLDDINLLSYPFLCHELGHNLLRNDSMFRESLEAELTRFVGNLRLAAIADRGAAQSRSTKIIEDIRTVWEPTADHKNWAHELAIDMVALWVCGPAYLAAFEDVVQDPEINPYQIGQNHPPYEVRLSALIEASERLGWDHYVDDLRHITRDWRRSSWRRGRGNRYAALTDSQLMRACVGSALEYCAAFSLPKCTEEQINLVRDDIGKNAAPNFGTDLILAAWLVQRERSQDFDRWERSTIDELLGFVTQ